VKNQRGVVYLETLIGFAPVFMFFLGTLQVADLSAAHLMVEHAATTAARAAVVVLPDDGAYYEDVDNAKVDEFRDYRQSDVERAADTILAANPRLDKSSGNVALDKEKYEERELVKAQVSAPYRCLVPMFCPGGILLSAEAQLIYQGAHYIYEPSTGWASTAANRGLDNIKNKISDYKEKKKKEQEAKQGNGDETKPDDDKAKPDDDKANPDDDKAKPDDDKAKPDDDATKPDDDDDPTNDKANQKKVDDLRAQLPPKLRDVPIKVDSDLPGSTVQVHYTHDDKGRITGIEVRVGPDAQARHIQDHVPTIKVMQRYQGVAGKARALAQKFKSWLTGHPNAGPGTLAWETHREVEKLNGIIENRAKQLEDPNLTPAQRTELEKELDSYEKQLAEHEKVLEEVTNEPGRGYVAANSDGRTPKEQAQEQYGKDGKPVPDPPPGYHWTFDGEKLIVARDRVEVDGQEIPPRFYDPATGKFPERPDNVLPPRYLSGTVPSEHPASTEVEKRAKTRQAAANAASSARDVVDKLAKDAGVPDDVDVKDAKGLDTIKKLREDAIARGDTEQVKALDALKQARENLTDKRAKLTWASEQLGNQMAKEYMKEHFGPNGDIAPGYKQTFPDPKLPETPGKSGEFDYVYTQGGNPPTDIIIVEAKGASSDLGSANTADGKASQGSPEYLKEIAGKMAAKETDPKLKQMWLDIAEGNADAPNVRYLVVKAPVDDNGKPLPGQISEFDIKTPRPKKPTTNP
jgi:hypothetical protein